MLINGRLWLAKKGDVYAGKFPKSLQEDRVDKEGLSWRSVYILGAEVGRAPVPRDSQMQKPCGGWEKASWCHSGMALTQQSLPELEVAGMGGIKLRGGRV